MITLLPTKLKVSLISMSQASPGHPQSEAWMVEVTNTCARTLVGVTSSAPESPAAVAF
jgi:hypothetical protein